MSNYEGVKALVQGFEQEIDTLSHDLGHIEAHCSRLFKLFTEIRTAVDNLNGNTEPVDWDSLIDDAEGAEAYAREALENAERSSQEAEELESSVTEVVGYAEQAVSNCDDTVSSYRDLADTLRRAKEQNSGE